MDKSTKIGFVFSTKDRLKFTLDSLLSIDTEGGFDLLWVDGSAEAKCKSLSKHIRLQNCQIAEVHKNVTGGPTKAIHFGLKRLLELGYDYCGLIENDIRCESGWFTRLKSLFDQGYADGFKVGATTVRTMESRVLSYVTNYVLMWNVGAGIVLFSAKAAKIIVDMYDRAEKKEYHVSAKILKDFYQEKFRVNLSDVWEMWIGKKDRSLGYDWAYAMELYKHDLFSLGSIPSMAFNMDCDITKVLRSQYVR